MKTQVQDLRSMKVEELVAHIAGLEHEYRIQRAAVREGKERNSANLGFMRRQIAQAKTVFVETHKAKG